MSAPTLPIELVSLILDLLYTPIPHLDQTSSLLAQCCLVSRAFLPLARTLLYRGVQVEVIGALPLMIDDETGESSPDHSAAYIEGLSSRSIAVGKTLLLYPYLANLVTEAYLAVFEEADSDGSAPALIMGTLLRCCDRVSSITVEGIFDRQEVWRMITLLRPGLKNLCLRDSFAFDKAALDFILQLPDLKILSIEDDDIEDYGPPAPLPVPPFHLTKLESFTQSERLFAVLTSTTSTTLSSLSCRAEVAKPATLLRFSQLQHLNLRTTFMNPEVSEVEQTTELRARGRLLVAQLDSCRHLLTLAIGYLGARSSSFCTTHDILSHLPPSLIHLHLGLPLDPAYVVDFLAKRSGTMALRTITFTACATKDVQRIKEAFEERGIRAEGRKDWTLDDSEEED